MDTIYQKMNECWRQIEKKKELFTMHNYFGIKGIKIIKCFFANLQQSVNLRTQIMFYLLGIYCPVFALTN